MKKRSIKGKKDLRNGDKIVVVKNKKGWNGFMHDVWNNSMDKFLGTALTVSKVASCGHIRVIEVIEDGASMWCWYEHMVDWKATEALNNGTAEEPAPAKVSISDQELQKSFDFVKSMLRAGYEDGKFVQVGIKVPHIGLKSGETKEIRVVFSFVPKDEKANEDAARIITELAFIHVANLGENAPMSEVEGVFSGRAIFNVEKEGFEKFSPLLGYNLAMQRAIIEAKEWERDAIEAPEHLMESAKGMRDLFEDFFSSREEDDEKAVDEAVDEELKNQAGETVTGQEEVPVSTPEEPEIPTDAIRSPLYRDLHMSIGGRPYAKYNNLTLMVDAYGVVNMIKQTDEGDVSYPCRIGKLFKEEGSFPTSAEAKKAYNYYNQKYDN